MTPQQIEALKLALGQLQAGFVGNAMQILREALAEHAMQETQRLGQEIEQEPVISKWVLREVYFDEDGEPVMHRSPPQPEQEPVAYNKTEMNCFVQDLYDKKMQEGKHGHYETMFHVVHQAIKRVAPPQRTWVGLNDDEIDYLIHLAYTGDEEFVQTIEAKLKEKNT